MKRKLERYKTISERDNVLERGKGIYLEVKGNWRKQYFKNDNPVTVELACGRGEYAIGMASLLPERNFIGVDIKGDRIWRGSTLAEEQGLNNVAFLRAHILTIQDFFEVGEVDEMWLTFPDPRPKKRDVKRRLTHSRFLDLYKRIMKPGGVFRLKTDNTGIFQYTLEELASRSDIEELKYTEDIYLSEMRSECYDIKTKYEIAFADKGEKIKYLRFQFKN